MITVPGNYIYGLRTVDDPTIRYVGQTTSTLDRRFKNHVAVARRGKRHYPVCLWIMAHGPENIQLVLLEASISIVDLDDREIFWIAELDTYLHDSKISGLNCDRGGRTRRDFRHSDETRAKMIIDSTERMKSETTRSAISKSISARFESSEARQQVSDSLRGVPKTEEHRRKISEALKKKWQDPEYRNSITQWKP